MDMFADMRLLEGDCLDQLPTLDADSIDLVMTSPPYSNQRAKSYGGIPADQYVEWWLPRADAIQRVLKPTGSFVLNIKEHAEGGQLHRYTYELVLAMRDAGWRLVDELIWHKTNIFPHPHGNRLDCDYERLYHFTKAAGHKFYKDAVKIPSRDASGNRYRYDFKKADNPSGLGINSTGKRRRPDAVYPRNTLSISPANGGNAACGWHSATYPPALPAFFIGLMTEPGDAVLDPFVGSGTTMFQAYRMDRRGIGIELSAEYCAKLRELMDNEAARLPF